MADIIKNALCLRSMNRQGTTNMDERAYIGIPPPAVAINRATKRER